jgi:hypothetical protein
MKSIPTSYLMPLFIFRTFSSFLKPSLTLFSILWSNIFRLFSVQNSFCSQFEVEVNTA